LQYTIALQLKLTNSGFCLTASSDQPETGNFKNDAKNATKKNMAL
jgi:hypothetical protein